MFMDEPAFRRFAGWLFVLGLWFARPGDAMPTNVILFIGDGMGHNQVAAAGLYAHGASGTLSFEAFPNQAQVTTRSADAAITDSAAAATAMATGRKVDNGVISVASPGDGRELPTVLEQAAAAGKATGLVTTTDISHATPAAFAAHEPSRYNSAGIVQDYLQQTRPNVLFGGSQYLSESQAAAAGYAVVTDAAQLKALNAESATFVSGQFAAGNMTYEYDRTETAAEPHLSEMTAAALDILDNNPMGFFLMVEGGRIDRAAHDHDLARMIHETLEFSRAVQTALDWAAGSGPSDTLILVTADHETGGLDVLAGMGVGQYPDVAWSTAGHTGANVPIYGWGCNSEWIAGVMDNTAVYSVMTATPRVVPASGALTLTSIGLIAVALLRGRRAI
jgi:alkaline phosphatase